MKLSIGEIYSVELTIPGFKVSKLLSLLLYTIELYSHFIIHYIG